MANLFENPSESQVCGTGILQQVLNQTRENVSGLHVSNRKGVKLTGRQQKENTMQTLQDCG